MNQPPSTLLKYRLTAGRSDEAWEPITLGWASPASDWLVAHDVFHHLPNDNGTLAEEFASLGAEYYVCFENQPRDESEGLAPTGFNALARSAAGIIGMLYDLPGEPGHFMLTAADSAEVPATVAEIFEAAQASAISEMDMLVGDFPSKEVEWHAALKSVSQPGVIASWIRQGYFAARLRFPDQELVRKSFEETLDAVRRARKSSAVGQEICLQLNGAHATLTLT